MRKIYLIFFLLVFGLSTTGIAAEKSFKATLSGDECVPAVTTKAKGEATFELSKDGKELSYNVIVSDIENVTAAHIHQGKKGENGPPVALIDIKGKKGKITVNELMSSLKGKTVKDLVEQIESGNAYINVHTGQHPDGEIRGQIK